jgi:hypothetical protein
VCCCALAGPCVALADSAARPPCVHRGRSIALSHCAVCCCALAGPCVALADSAARPPCVHRGGALPSATALCVAVPSLAPVLPLLTVLRIVLLLAVVDAVLAVLGSGG